MTRSGHRAAWYSPQFTTSNHPDCSPNL